MSTFTFKQAFIDITTTIQNGIQTLGHNPGNSSSTQAKQWRHHDNDDGAVIQSS